MMRELETLLEFHAALGGSSIILSATLPITLRRKLVGAFRKGISEVSASDELQANAYPLVTIVGPDKAEESPQPIRAGLTRFVTATRIDDLNSALARVTAAAETGACVAFVRNSVNEAIAACHHERPQQAHSCRLLIKKLLEACENFAYLVRSARSREPCFACFVEPEGYVSGPKRCLSCDGVNA
jgi:hypothetical protein